LDSKQEIAVIVYLWNQNRMYGLVEL